MRDLRHDWYGKGDKVTFLSPFYKMHFECDSKDSTKWFGIAVVLVVVLLQMSGASVMGDECDWTGRYVKSLKKSLFF